jgi:hypothetical protein
MSHRWRIVAVFAVVLAVGGPPTALALGTRSHQVAPAPSVRAAILNSWNGGSPPSRAYAACLVVWLAASNRAYGTVRFRLTRRCEGRWGFNGVNVLKRGLRGHWSVVFEGSAYRCPVARVPRQVQRDLGVCG